ncbi:T9SS type B sorting domain-containing protein [Hymenobacter cellulosilyticus]|uniref:Gliding motility-associated C-terminal domain-containing protein n=1 Tax=Hymenobacter cellulosilyticus TaxID=2932248 RepID=A0A8T9QB37_9BACT|nr:gliding motility-associated C-terminal domain-containing protein [Hymenobacter cellulosilyticus]UOQ74774.1 gliding motility-associated C-terminal domain-containing protein [Hymenobacter cellulosilyticus]
MNLSLPRSAGKWVLVLMASVLSLFGLHSTAQASHIRAGDIQAKSDTTYPFGDKRNNPRRIFFKMVTYTDFGSTKVDEPAVTIFFGDGTSSGKNGVPRFSRVQVTEDTYRNVYYFEHTYNADRSYTVSYIGENRKTGVQNMSESDQQTFFIATRITIDPALGINRSPVLNAPAIDKASFQQVFLHNPAASDADGDSLTYEIRESYQAGSIDNSISNNNTPIDKITTGFVFPNQVSAPGVRVPYLNEPTGSGAIFRIGLNDGQLVWNSPNRLGDFNVAVIVREWRRTEFGVREMGYVIRDMQIQVQPTNNKRPTVNIPADICVVAGVQLRKKITATDPDNDPVVIEAYSGLIGRRVAPATFSQSNLGPNPIAQGIFRWTPECGDVSSQPYLVVFKATDKPKPGETPLIDEKVLRIRVVGPRPENVRAQQNINNVLLTWDRYACQNASKLLIYRKEGPSNFPTDTCQTGIPASSGFVKIAELTDVSLQAYLDNGATSQLQRGRTYCYRIYAEFPLPAGGASLASLETCVTLQGRPAVLTHATVDITDRTAGQVTVRWTQPKTSGSFQAPFGYTLYRGTGRNATQQQSEVVKTSSDLKDTVFVDRGRNTLENAFTYRLEFFQKDLANPTNPVVERSGPASTVRLSGVPNESANQVRLNWSFKVPWKNTEPGRYTVIYRRNPGSADFVRLDSVQRDTTYIDRGDKPQFPLRPGETYSYYVRTNGTYNDPNLPDPLLNLSQRLTVLLVPTPCPPVVTVQSDCEQLKTKVLNRPGYFPAPGETYTNQLTWELNPKDPEGCSTDIAYYRIFYRRTTDTDFTLIDSTSSPVRSYSHRGLSEQAACYKVQAVGVLGGRRSALSAEVCVDNCIIFELPNIFTPNGDGINDTFRPRVASPLRKVRFQAFNRWGVKVFEGDGDPNINWTGNATSGERGKGVQVPDGVYYYLAEVEFADANSTKITYKGWVEITH